MNHLKYVLYALVLYTGVIFSQGAAYVPYTVNEQKTRSVSQRVKDAVDDAKIVDINTDAVRNIVSSKPERLSLRLPVDNRFYDVTLNRFDILTPDAQIVSGTTNGDKSVKENLRFVSYTSDLHDKNSPLFVFSFYENEMSAVVISGDETYVLAKIDNADPNSEYIMFQSTKVKLHNDFKCGTESFEIPEQIKEMQKNLTGQVDFATSDILTARIAVESDYETYTFYGGTLNASNYILRLMSPVSAIYVRDMNIKLVVTYLRVWETINDPYPDATSSNTLLTSFRSYWNSNMSSVSRTLAHMITTRPGGLGGIAYVNVLCASPTAGSGYAFSDIDGSFNPIPTYSWDVMVVAHETGHNFGSPHTHSCTWPGGPIDSCYAVEGNCYNGPAIARVGTIMSYCHLNGSISLTNGFGPLPMQLIRQRAESAGCITTATGYLVAMPNGGEIFRVGNNTLIVWGSSFTGTVDIELTTNNGTNWTPIQNNVDASLRNINWSIPSLNATTTQARVRVFQSGNPGNGDQSDSTFQIRPNISTFSLVSPPLFTRVYTSPTDTTRINFTFTKAGNLPELRYKWHLNNFNNTVNFNMPTNNAGVDTVASVRISQIDSIISGWGIASGDSLRGRWSAKAHSMFDSLGPTNSNFLITFIRSPIGIQPVSSNIPKEYFVSPNYPNPFNPVTKIKFGLPKHSFVKITVYDILGKEVSVLVNEQLNAGEFEADWDAAEFTSGIYFYRIEANDFVRTAKMILVK
jgi:hypothetical protein